MAATVRSVVVRRTPTGQRVHGFLVRPDGEGPYPVILRVHGGPHSRTWTAGRRTSRPTSTPASSSRWSTTAAPVGFGQAWRDELKGNIGFLELEDVLAGLDDLVGRGLADPARVVLAGWSWGGYLTLLGARAPPGPLVRVRVGGVPVADYVAAYEDESADPPGARPLAVRRLAGRDAGAVPRAEPDRVRRAVRIPLLILAGENDSRCPIRQVWNYVDRLRDRRRGARGLHVLDRPLVVRHRGARPADGDRARSPGATVPGIRRLDGLDAHLAAAGVRPAAVTTGA